MLRTPRLDREDTTRQQQAVTEAREVLARSLDRLENEARLAARALRRPGWKPTTKTPRNMLDEVHAARVAVDRAEQALDLADVDLAGASGEDV